MTYRYTRLDDHEGIDGSSRFEIDDMFGFTVCVVDDEDTARLFSAAPDLLEATEAALGYLTDHAIDLDGESETALAGLRFQINEAVAKAKGGAA